MQNNLKPESAAKDSEAVPPSPSSLPNEDNGCSTERIKAISHDLRRALTVLERGGISYAEIRNLELQDYLDDARQTIYALRTENKALRAILAEAIR